jgi:hypothetical protein
MPAGTLSAQGLLGIYAEEDKTVTTTGIDERE